MKILYVLYKPGLKRVGSDAAVLSFMSPDDEHRAASRYSRLFFGRKEMDVVREDARKSYVDIVSRIAATECGGRTLRQVLEIAGRGNPWWYHPVSEKHVETDATFNMLLQIFTVLHVADREGIKEIVIYGSSIEIILALRTRYRTSGIKCSSGWKTNLIRAVLARIKYLFTSLRSYSDIQRSVLLPELSPDVVFQGFWDWSVQIDRKSQEVEDIYFRSLPDKFRDNGMKCAWFVCLDPRSKYGIKPKSVSDLLHPAKGKPELIFVQKFLKPTDILSVIFDIRAFFRYIRYSLSNKFRGLFKEKGCDLWPLFSRQLAYSFCDSALPHYYLIETAYKRAFGFYKPKLSFAFLELCLISRAFNQGAAFGSPLTIRCDMQHASYAREKTFILADSDRELLGKPDKKAMPLPDNFFVMGELCRDILVEDGVPSGKIFITGSARYDYLIQGGTGSQRVRTQGPVKVLIVSTINVHLDFEMVQAAVLASEGLNIKLFLRSHPFVKIEDVPDYRQYSKAIVSSMASLDDDLNLADIVLFTYSTVAEEAFLKGIPVLRWQANGFNGSVFRDVNVVPSAYSVESLKEQFGKFLDDPLSFKPDEKLRDLILRKCFYRVDGMASSRIAEKVIELLARS